MVSVFNFDFTNVAHANAFAQIMAIAQSANVPMDMLSPNPQNQPTLRSEEPTRAKAYADAVDVQCKYVLDGKCVAYTLADGKYVGQSSVRKTLNARLRNSGALWDSVKKAWTFPNKAKAEAFVKADNALVTASEINEVRAKAQAREAKKANKGA